MRSRKELNFIYSIIAAISIIIIISVFIAYQNTNKFNKFEDPGKRYSIKYPVDWKVEESKNGAAVIFSSPKENKLDMFSDNVNIVVQDISSNPMGIKKYSEIAIKQMQIVFGDNLEIKESESITLGGREGYKFVFNGKGAQVELGYKSVWTIDGLTAYQITYTSLASMYNNHIKEADRMIKSFKIH